jgi:pyruvate/2-oxoglutarate dehydrogenase complex dihydrolipoamide dehydrogenase (E3) component
LRALEVVVAGGAGDQRQRGGLAGSAVSFSFLIRRSRLPADYIIIGGGSAGCVLAAA